MARGGRMSRHLIAAPPEDALIRRGVGEVVNGLLAEDVIAGRVIHNVETDEMCPADLASGDFRAAAVAAYARLLAKADTS